MMESTPVLPESGKSLPPLVDPADLTADETIGPTTVSPDTSQARRTQDDLCTSEEFRQALFESIPECIQVLDRNGTVLQINPAGLAMLDADLPEQVVGHPIYPFIDQEHAPAFRALNESVFDGSSGGRLDYSVRGFRGVERLLETNVVPLR